MPRIFVDRILCLIVIVISGNPALAYFSMSAVLLFVFLLLITIALARNLIILRSDIIILSTVFLILLTQLMVFGSEVIVSVISFFAKLLIALVAIRMIPRFERRVVEVMFVLSIISLIFYIPLWLGLDMINIVKPLSIPFEQNGIQPMVSIGVHNYRIEVTGINRNSGMFWEAGAFAGYLVLAMLFSIADKERHFRVFLLVLTVALLTTQSTTGYVAFSMIVIIYLWKITMNMKLVEKYNVRIMLSIFIPVITVFIYTQVTFLENKITDQYFIGHQQIGKQWHLSRYGNAIYDMELIMERPIVGWSPSINTRSGEDIEVLSRQGNGLTGIMTRLGIPFLILYVGMMFWWFLRKSGDVVLSILSVCTVLMLLIGEQFLIYPVFMILIFKYKETGFDGYRGKKIL